MYRAGFCFLCGGGYVWVCVDMCGYVWVCVGMCGYVWVWMWGMKELVGVIAPFGYHACTSDLLGASLREQLPMESLRGLQKMRRHNCMPTCVSSMSRAFSLAVSPHTLFGLPALFVCLCVGLPVCLFVCFGVELLLKKVSTGSSSEVICYNWNDAEKISIVPAQG